MKKPPPVWLPYALFALAALGANLLVQWLLSRAGDVVFGNPPGTVTVFGAALPAGEIVYWGALAAGTLAGFFVKYVLDKKYIFRFRAGSAKAGLKVIVLYGATAVITTLVFWGVQRLFVELWDHEAMKYAGGAAGLVPGYILKYFLDRRFVFRKDNPPCT